MINDIRTCTIIDRFLKPYALITVMKIIYITYTVLYYSCWYLSLTAVNTIELDCLQ